MASTVFLSYSSAQAAEAERIELAAAGEGHRVFRDRSALPAGDSFDARIRAAIDDSDLFVFLISPRAVEPGRYTLTELEFARRRWGHPQGHVLPVLAAPTDLATVPPFLRAVTILEPRGDLAAEVVAAIDRMAAPWWRRLARPPGLVALSLLVVLLAAGLWQGIGAMRERRQQRAAAQRLLDEGALLAQSGNRQEAWRRYAKAADVAPGEADVVAAQERLAMEWLRDVRTSESPDGTFRGIVEQVLPVLSRGAAAAAPPRAADLLAHLGWAEFLLTREGQAGLDPIRHYRRALAADPDNVYAHTMWGFEILRTAGPLADANGRFAAALASGRERPWVRRMQLAALQWRGGSEELEDEAIRVANEMRLRGEAMPDGEVQAQRSLWTTYDARLVRGTDPAAFLALLPPAEHLATFRWLFPEESFFAPRYRYLAVLGRLTEQAGLRTEARAAYRALQDELARHDLRGTPLMRTATEAVRRLSNQP